jgi:hypothetical protein
MQVLIGRLQPRTNSALLHLSLSRKDAVQDLSGSLDSDPGDENLLMFLHDAAFNARLPYGDAQDWKLLQQKVGNALSRNFAQPDQGPSISKSRAYWATFADSLLTDPAAEQAPLPSADALFG